MLFRSGPPRYVVLQTLLLGPNERYVANVGAVDRVGPVVQEPDGVPGQAPITTDLPAQAANGSVPGTLNRRGTTMAGPR